jgi:hypothetical protein
LGNLKYPAFGIQSVRFECFYDPLKELFIPIERGDVVVTN